MYLAAGEGQKAAAQAAVVWERWTPGSASMQLVASAAVESWLPAGIAALWAFVGVGWCVTGCHYSAPLGLLEYCLPAPQVFNTADTLSRRCGASQCRMSALLCAQQLIFTEAFDSGHFWETFKIPILRKARTCFRAHQMYLWRSKTLHWPFPLYQESRESLLTCWSWRASVLIAAASVLPAVQTAISS